MSGIGTTIFFLVIMIALLGQEGNRGMALRGLRRRGRTGWLTIFALAVGTAVIMSSLAVGDALKGFVIKKANENLNGVDIVVLSADFFDQEIVNSRNLKIPHPRIAERRFVLLPLAEVAPDERHPQLGLTYQALWNAFDPASRAGLRRVDFDWE